MFPGHLCKSLQQLYTNKTLSPVCSFKHQHTHTLIVWSGLSAAQICLLISLRKHLPQGIRDQSCMHMHPPPPSPFLWAFAFTCVSNVLISAYRRSFSPSLHMFSFVFYCSPSLYLNLTLVHHSFNRTVSAPLIQVIPLMELCNLYKMNQLVIQTLL